MIGYARVSTDDQDLSLQLDGLKAAGCEPIFTDKISGSKERRPGLDKCLAQLTAGDTLVVWRLDRLGRSLPHLVEVVSDLKERKVGFRSLRDGAIDTTTPSGELVFHIFAAMAQFERELIRERTRAGLAAARARGRQGGRRPKSPHDPKVKAAKAMHAAGTSIEDICKSLGCSTSTLYRWLKVA
jgi:DNA invertase Pin-like site-specific DNA recombinase